MVFLVFWLVRTSCTPSRRLAPLAAKPGLRAALGRRPRPGSMMRASVETRIGKSLTAVNLSAASLRPARHLSRAPDGVPPRSATLDRCRSDLRTGSYEVNAAVWVKR
jgi:hypothetical protein